MGLPTWVRIGVTVPLVVPTEVVSVMGDALEVEMRGRIVGVTGVLTGVASTSSARGHRPPSSGRGTPQGEGRRIDEPR